MIRLHRSVQRFIDCYAPDGGCDEGPGHFNVAGASLLDTLALLHAARVHPDAMLLYFEAALFTIHTEEIPIDDPNLRKAWKAGKLYRTLLTRTSIPVQDTYTLTYTIR